MRLCQAFKQRDTKTDKNKVYPRRDEDVVCFFDALRTDDVDIVLFVGMSIFSVASQFVVTKNLN